MARLLVLFLTVIGGLANYGNAADLITQSMSMLPATTQNCVKGVATKAVTEAALSKLTSTFGQAFGGKLPTIERGQGQLTCKGDVPTYKETSYIRGNLDLSVVKLGSVPLNMPITTESDISNCVPAQLNYCKVLGGSNGGLLGLLGGGNQQAPAAGGGTGNALGSIAGLLGGSNNGK